MEISGLKVYFLESITHKIHGTVENKERKGPITEPQGTPKILEVKNRIRSQQKGRKGELVKSEESQKEVYVTKARGR